MRVPYQYVVLRYVPRVDREEFLNVGVVLHSQAADLLACAVHLDEARLRALDPAVDLDALRATLDTLTSVCGSEPPAHPPLSTLGKRFGWIAAPRSTVIQPSPVHSGLSEDPAGEADRLVTRLVRQDASHS